VRLPIQIDRINAHLTALLQLPSWLCPGNPPSEPFLEPISSGHHYNRLDNCSALLAVDMQTRDMALRRKAAIWSGKLAARSKLSAERVDAADTEYTSIA
jgi:hypothetical protein